MKKIFTVLAILFVFSLGVNAAETFGQNTAQATQNIFNQMVDAISKDVQNSADSMVNAGVNSLKLASYKAQLAQKKRELRQQLSKLKQLKVKIFPKQILQNIMQHLPLNKQKLKRWVKLQKLMPNVIF